MDIQSLLSETRGCTNWKPKILRLKDKGDLNIIKRLFSKGKIRYILDNYEAQLEEYYAICNPELIFQGNFKDSIRKYIDKKKKQKPLYKQGCWVYFPWLSTISHILEDSEFYIVRTARNRDLITEEEQKKFYQSTVGIAGLSVGNSIALAIVLQGGGRRIRLADHDKLELSNLNRIRAGINDLGRLKVEITAQQIYTLNPYAEIELYPEGLTKYNISSFFDGLDIIIDEIDDLAIKYLIRKHAKQNKIPVVMAADNGDNAVVDIERYDQDSELEFFHGRMGNISYKKLSDLNKIEIGKMITRHIGFKNIPLRMQKSLLNIGKTIVSWPQLGGTALLNGSVVAYCVRRILNKQPLENNRIILSLDEKSIPGYNSNKSIKERQGKVQEFKQALDYL